MLIRGYGLFWRRDEIEWRPGAGNKDTFQLLGRHGANVGTLRVIDARFQSGIYILYGNLGPYYVGLTSGNNGLGSRLKDHTVDAHKSEWDRFSWFGFKPILKSLDRRGFNRNGKMATYKPVSPASIIRDVEALFKGADCWTQIKWHEREKYTSKVGS